MGVNPVFTRLQVALNPHRMTPFLLRRNKSAQLLKIYSCTDAKLTVSSSSSDVNSDILINQIKKGQEAMSTNERTNGRVYVVLSDGV